MINIYTAVVFKQKFVGQLVLLTVCEGSPGTGIPHVSLFVDLDTERSWRPCSTHWRTRTWNLAGFITESTRRHVNLIKTLLSSDHFCTQCRLNDTGYHQWWKREMNYELRRSLNQVPRSMTEQTFLLNHRRKKT